MQLLKNNTFLLLTLIAATIGSLFIYPTHYTTDGASSFGGLTLLIHQFLVLITFSFNLIAFLLYRFTEKRDVAFICTFFSFSFWLFWCILALMAAPLDFIFLLPNLLICIHLLRLLAKNKEVNMIEQKQ